MFQLISMFQQMLWNTEKDWNKFEDQHEMGQNLETFTAWNVFIFGVFLVRIFPHSDQKNSEYGHFLRSVSDSLSDIQ